MNDVSLLEMMNAREMRCQIQKSLLQTHPCTLICFTLNIPGPVKVPAGAQAAFYEGCRQIVGALHKRQFPVVHQQTREEKTGCECFFSVDASPEEVKRAMIPLEEDTPLGRIFDIDVLRTDGSKVSREELGFPERTCFLCGQPAHVCSRSRAHSLEELTGYISAVLAPFSEHTSAGHT